MTAPRLVALALVGLVSCARSGPKSGAKRPPEKPPVAVRVATVEQKAEPLEARTVGRVEALETVGVKTLVGGELVEVHFQEGDEVRQGQLLLALDRRPYEAALAQAKALVAHDVAQWRQARRDARRYGSLVKKGYVTLEQAAQERSNAQALAASVQADRAAVQSAELNLSYCEIRSPIAGKIGRLEVKRGNIVKANADTALVTINQMKPIGVAFALPASSLPLIQEHLEDGPLSALARPPGAQRGTRGALTFIDNAVDVATGTIGLRATFLNEDETLWPGEPVDVVLTLAVQRKAIVVPSGAVQEGQKGAYAFVVKPDHTVEERPLQVDRTIAEETIVAGGLTPGEVVVTDGALALVPGARVQVNGGARPATSPGTSRAPSAPPRGREVPR